MHFINFNSASFKICKSAILYFGLVNALRIFSKLELSFDTELNAFFQNRTYLKFRLRFSWILLIENI